MRHRIFPSIVFFVCIAEARAQDWPRFRGPNGSGLAPAVSFALPWSEENHVWRVKLPGRGHSSPIVRKDQVYVTAGDEKTMERSLLCFRVSDGRLLWQRSFRGESHRRHEDNSLASSTPTADARHVYVTWASPKEYLVIALDHQGSESWRVDLGPYKAGHGFGVSPIVYDDMLIIANEQDGKSFIVALDCKNGAERWKTPRRSRCTYATPCVFHGELIFANYEHGISALDPKTGKTNWELDVFDKGHIETSIASPFVSKDRIFAMSGWLGVKKEVIVARPGNVTYKLTKGAPLVPTPVVKDDLLFLWNDEGVVTCADVATGKTHWQERIEGSFYSSPICIGDMLVCPSREGDVYFLRASKTFEPPARTALGEGSHATPAVADGRIFVRTFSQLLCVGKKP